MKKILKRIFFLAGAVLMIHACHDLDVPLKSKLTPETFPTKPEHFLQLSGTVYSQFRENYAGAYWFMQVLSTDEAMLPARGGNWLDGGRYQQLHLHTWTKDLPQGPTVWNWLSRTISLANQTLYYFEQAPDSKAKSEGVAEVRTMRAICYFLMMDLWGNIPVVMQFGDTSAVKTTKRPEVFKIIEDDVKEVIRDLSTDMEYTYGRPNKYTAFALLAKMYLNAEAYTGTARWTDAVAMCDSVIKSGKFHLEPNYKKMFDIDNGPQIKEFIFTLPFDNSITTGGSSMYFGRYYLHKSMRAKYSLPYTPSGAMNTLSTYYAYFDDPNDVRNRIWLTGKQYDHKGQPITIKTTNKGYDEDYSGPDPGAEYIFHVELTPDVILKNVNAFDAGNDEKSWAQGYRLNKFYPDSTSLTRNQDNDVPIFRYADILLTKAEAIARGASSTEGQTAQSLVNELRTVRKAATFPAVTLKDIYAERCRELVGEFWHRNDMIRFGKFEESWGYKTDSDPHKRIYAIPTSAIEVNPGLEQNPGY